MISSEVLASHLRWMVPFRHELHQIPELGYEEHQTAARIRQQLDQLGIEYTAGVADAPTATIAVIGDPAKPCIALRADIDALPIVERSGLPYASRHDGRMHACGHDGHTTTLLGTAAVLKSMVEELPVCVKLLWQPAEEGGAGADRLVGAGVLDGRVGPAVRAIFGLHGYPGMKVGMVASKAGVLMASTDNFVARFVGKGCHGAFPSTGIDPIVAAAEAVVNLQQIVGREIDPTECAVVTVGQIHAGTAVNIIPDTAWIAGTARAHDGRTRAVLGAAIRRRCEGVAAAGGCRLEFEWSEGYHPTVNDAVMADYVARTARTVLGESSYYAVPRAHMGGEDFSSYLLKVPGCFFFVGTMPADRNEYPALHNDHYDFTDQAMETGVRMFVELVKGAKGISGMG